MKKLEEEEKENGERWLLTYSDLITLLMIFFVVMYAISNVDSIKYSALSKSLNAVLDGGTGYSLGNGSGAVTDIGQPGEESAPDAANQAGDTQMSADTANLLSLKNDIEKYLKDESLGDSVVVQTEERGLAISLKDSILFESGKADIRGDARETVIKIGKIISRIDGYVRVEGHTDNVPIKNQGFKSNWELSALRATNVVELLIDNSGISPNKISAAGYGEFRPVADNSTADGRAKNRRVEIVIFDSKYDDAESGKK